MGSLPFFAPWTPKSQKNPSTPKVSISTSDGPPSYCKSGVNGYKTLH